MRKGITIIALIICLVVAGAAFAGTGSSVLSISTRVISAFTYTVMHSESALIITKKDIEKGYVDIRRGLVLSVKTNSTNGYVLWIALNDDLLSNVKMFSENNAYSLSRSGGEVHMPYQGNDYFEKEFSFRLYFSPKAKPGMYEWPLSIMASGA